ncbi:MAG: amidohydrolase [Stagnimonas sp.]|nr:amidohydrolase [Stagnimonas sp.]
MRPSLFAVAASLSLLLSLGACDKSEPKTGPYASTYAAPVAPALLITHATILTGAGRKLEDASLLVQDGKIVAVGNEVAPPPQVEILDAKGRWLTPGLIDAHSHLGVYPSPEIWATADGNELTDPVTPNVWSEHSVWPQDPGFEAARAGGITSLLILPGSGNLIGGRGTVFKNLPATSYQTMKFPGAPYSLKMACGENPKRVYGKEGKKAPATRMGNVAGYRAAFIKAQEYAAKHKDGGGEGRDLGMETLAGVLKGEILVQNHCYRADEMETMLDLAKEFEFKISTFHHAVEAYKIAGRLAEEGVCGALWADWWGFKLEAWDGIRENIAIVDAAVSKSGARGCAIVHSDDPYGIQRLNQEAAKAMAAGRRAGLVIRDEDAIAWITANPARAIGIGDQTGSLEPGKNADLVLWNGTPFSSYALADRVYIDGTLRYDRASRKAPDSDFALGLAPPEEALQAMPPPPPPPPAAPDSAAAPTEAAPAAAETQP